MQPNFTQKNIGHYLKNTAAALVLCCFFAGVSNAQQYVNGNLSTGPTSSNGVAAPAGTTWSEVQSGNINAGFGANIGAGLTIADNFVISCGSWTINKFTFFAYSTGYAGATSPFNDVRLQIYNTNPSVGSPTPIFGDLTTNRFTASSFANVFRIFNATPDQTRRVWRIEVNIPALNLTSGNYWVEWQLGTVTAGASNFSPASTVVGTVTQPGNNGLQRTLPSAWVALLDGANAQDMPFIIDYTGAACAGIPAPGATNSTVTTACPGVPFSLSLANCTPGTGVTYQWQSATAIGGPYNNITGGTGPTLTTSQTAPMFYQAIVTCGANTGTSTPVPVALTPAASCYCDPVYADGCALGDFISNVTLLTLNNNSTCSNPPFTYYSALAAPTLIRGATYPVSVTVGPDTFGQFVGIWVDWNRDGDYADPGEFQSTPPVNAGAGGTVVVNITVPPGATLGTTRMRVRGGDDLAPTAGQSCGASNSSFGEAEDYNVTIAPCVQGVFTVQPVNTSVQCSGNMSFAVTATGSALTYSWQYRVNATSPWLTVTNSALYSGATTPTLVLLNVPGTMTGYQYRALIQGPCTAVDFSAPATLTVTPLVATVSPTSATICTGSIQQLTLTNPTSTPIYGAPSGLPAAIPDANATGINSTINVSNVPVGAVVTNISVTLNITHPWVSDLEIVLQGPGNNRINLSDLVSGTNQSGANFAGTVFSSAAGLPAISTGIRPGYTGTFRADAIPGPTGAFGVPAGPTGFLPTTSTWTPFMTGALNGNWTIAMYDAGAPDAGTLTGWSINITYVAPPAQGVWTASPAAPNTMFTDPAATVPYVAGSLANTIYVKPTVNTSYSVVYSTTTPCVSAPTVIPVTVINPISAVVNPSNTAACVGNNATFTASAAGGPITYQWQVSSDGGATWTNITGATAGTLTVSGVTALMTNYRYRAVLSAAPCAGTSTTTAATLTVNPLPTVTLSAPDLTLTPGQTTTLTTTSSPAAAANGFSYTLDGAAIPGTTSTQVVGADGFGAYQARVTDVNGCVNLTNILTISGEASDRLWIYPNPSPGAFQVRLYYNGALTERRVVSIYTSTGQLISEKEFVLDDGTSPYMRMDFDLGRLTGGTYVVKVHNLATEKVVSGLLMIQR